MKCRYFFPLTVTSQAFITIAAVLMFHSAVLAQKRIDRSTNIQEKIKPQTTNDYLLNLQSGESAEIVVVQQGVDVVVEIRNPTGTLLNSIDSPTGRNGDEVAEIIAQETGTYRITVRPFDLNEPAGSYQLETRALRSIR